MNFIDKNPKIFFFIGLIIAAYAVFILLPLYASLPFLLFAIVLTALILFSNKKPTKK